jgi:hypothetical protein
MEALRQRIAFMMPYGEKQTQTDRKHDQKSRGKASDKRSHLHGVAIPNHATNPKLCAMSKQFEFNKGVFVVSADDVSTSAYDIGAWNAHETLPEEAREFIQIAMNKGRVYDLEEFMEQFNLEETIGANDWIFITDKY